MSRGCKDNVVRWRIQSLRVMRIASVVVLLVSATVFLVSGCDALLLGPSPHANWDDPDLALMKLRANAVDDRDIRVAWDWLDIERELAGEKPKVDEIIVKHRKGSPPETRLGGKKFKLKNFEQNTNPLWKHTFNKLEQDEEHYFALYMHEKGGRWTAPLYTSTHLDGVDKYTENRNALYYQTADILTSTLSSDEPQSFSGAINGVTDTNWALLYFEEIDRRSTVESVTLNIDNSAGATLVINPIRITPHSFEDLSVASIDHSLELETTVTAIDTVSGKLLTEIFAKAYYHISNGILVRTKGTSITINTMGIDCTVVRGD